MRRVLVALTVGALALTLAAPPVSAEATEAAPREDAAFDAINAKGDILSSTYTAHFLDIFLSSLKFRVTTRAGSDPVTSPAWHNTNTELRAFIDVTTSHAGPDFVATLETPQASAPFALVVNVTSLLGVSPEPVVCDTGHSFTEPNIYKITLASNCFAPLNPTKVRGRTALVWDPPPAGGTQGTDKAPDAGWGSPFLQAAP